MYDNFRYVRSVFLKVMGVGNRIEDHDYSHLRKAWKEECPGIPSISAIFYNFKNLNKYGNILKI